MPAQTEVKEEDDDCSDQWYEIGQNGEQAIRFLRHHVEKDSLNLLSTDDGQVLTSSNFKEYVGREFASTEAEEILRTLIQSWAGVHPGGALEFRDLFVSTDFTLEIFASSLETLISKGHIKELGQNVYMVK